jgi:acyl-CoA thioester hydrolase
MPRTYTCSFPIRYYECDPYGHVGSANYLRFATQAATEASADAGYDRAEYDALGTLWLIREAGLDYLRPVSYGETLMVKTWVSDFRRVRSRREYEMTVAGTGELAVRAYSDWIYLSVESGQPARIPETLLSAFLPESAPTAEAPKREPFPKPLIPPLGAFTARRRVLWQHLDMEGHMNSAWYLNLLEEVVMDAMEHARWPMQRAQEAGFRYAARKHRLEYLRPALLGDELRITTYLGEIGDDHVVRHCQVNLASGELIARAQSVWAFVDLDSGEPLPVPQEWLLDLEDQMAELPEDEIEGEVEE